MTQIAPSDYAEFLAQLKAQIRKRQVQALRAVNHELLGLYWDLGQSIHQKQQALGWGKAVVQTVARDLQAEFPGRNGFSAQNLWLMLQFFRDYSAKQKLQPLVREISWAKNLVILGRCKDDLERELYLRATARFGCTKAVLQHQIDNKSYEKYLLNQTNFDQALPAELRDQAALAIKDHYTFDFLELAEEHSERQLEQALVQNLRNFLAEMGGTFAFLSNQHRLKVGGQEYFIDLLLFHHRICAAQRAASAGCCDLRRSAAVARRLQSRSAQSGTDCRAHAFVGSRRKRRAGRGTATLWRGPVTDTLPGGTAQVTRTFKAPFARASNEDDYRVAWAFFESTGQSETVR
jgi:predicted nuclease of restriction endonuclease-like (RecB) superfamily